jgi:hypothetical protein
MLESYKSNKSYEDLKNISGAEVNEIIPGVLMTVKKVTVSGAPEPMVTKDDEGNVTGVAITTGGGETKTEEFSVLKLAIPIGETKNIVFADSDKVDIKSLGYDFAGTSTPEKILDLSGFEFDMSSLGIDKLSDDFHKFTQDIKTKIENLGK